MTNDLRLELSLVPAEPITGWLRTADGAERRFVGWLELLAALDAICASARRNNGEE